MRCRDFGQCVRCSWLLNSLEFPTQTSSQLSHSFPITSFILFISFCSQNGQNESVNRHTMAQESIWNAQNISTSFFFNSEFRCFFSSPEQFGLSNWENERANKLKSPFKGSLTTLLSTSAHKLKNVNQETQWWTIDEELTQSTSVPKLWAFSRFEKPSMLSYANAVWDRSIRFPGRFSSISPYL